MKTVFPKEPAQNFNEWISYIKSQINKSKKVEEKREEEEIKYYRSEFGDLRSVSTGAPITG